MNKWIATMSLWTFAVMLGILTMIHGWGLEAKSWWWIIGGGIIVKILVDVMLHLSRRE